MTDRTRVPRSPSLRRQQRRPPRRARISDGALRRLVALVRSHARAHPHTEMGCLLLGVWRAGVPWILGTLDQGTRAEFTGASVHFDAEYQEALYRLHLGFHPRDDLLGVAHLQPGSDSLPSRGDLESDRRWLRNDGPARGALFVILTLDEEGCREAFELRPDPLALRYRGVEIHAYWLDRDLPGYRPVRIESACGPDHGAAVARFIPVVRRRHNEINELCGTFPGARIGLLDLVGGPTVAVSLRLGKLEGLALVGAKGIRWLALLPDGEWRAFEPARAEPVAAGLEMLGELSRLALREPKRPAASVKTTAVHELQNTETQGNGRDGGHVDLSTTLSST